MTAFTLFLTLLIVPMGLSSNRYRDRYSAKRYLQKLFDVVDIRPFLLSAAFRAPDEHTLRELTLLYQEYETFPMPVGDEYPSLSSIKVHTPESMAIYDRIYQKYYVLAYPRYNDWETVDWNEMEKQRENTWKTATGEFLTELLRSGMSRGQVRELLKGQVRTYVPPMTKVP